MEQDIYTNQDPLEIEMEAEDGEKVKVKIVKLFEDGGKSYVVADNMDNEDEAYILQLIPHDDGDELISIESEEEFNRLAKIVESLEDEEEE
ncbi:MAG: DUF1292 domain-containing protein [Bacilli bacterium]|jgi:uncharacterized protein YrzB (UPF0473 family)|nr:DUF1292 domain-containing protein [Bacilli bacterium]